MPSIQVKGVPEEVHAVLRRRAALAGQSLQEYVLMLLRQDAETPTLEEVLDRVEHRSGGEADFETAARLVREEREAR
jgi:plasmid stability protein